MTPNILNGGWFKKPEPELRVGYPSTVARPRPSLSKKKRLILSQTMVIDVDPNKVCVVLPPYFVL
jgi:hypothetical protein